MTYWYQNNEKMIELYGENSQYVEVRRTHVRTHAHTPMNSCLFKVIGGVPPPPPHPRARHTNVCLEFSVSLLAGEETFLLNWLKLAALHLTLWPSPCRSELCVMPGGSVL